MRKIWHSLRYRVTAVLLALVCVFGLLPDGALAAGTDTIKLEKFGMSGVSYTSASLGTCTLHQMYYDYGGATAVGFCGTKGGGMGSSLIGQTWGDPREITDPTVKTMMAYYYAHSTGVFTDEAKALGVDTLWDAGYTWYMNAWVQAIIWRYQAGTMGDPTTACAEELMAVYNSLEHTSYTSIDQEKDGSSFRGRAQYILDLGSRVWGDCAVYEYSFTGAGSSAHPASSVQKVVIGELEVGGTEESYSLIVKKVDSTNPTKGLAGAGFHIEAANGSYSKDVVTGPDGTCRLDGLTANTYAVTETSSPSGYEIDNAGPEYVVLPGNGSNTVTVTFTDTPIITGSGSIRKVDADDPARGLAGAVIKIEGIDNNFSGTYVTVEGGALADVPWDTMPIGSFTAAEVTPPKGYSLSPDPDKVKQEFYWDGKSDVALVFENDARVKIRLLKKDDSDRPLVGAVFNVIKNGQVIASEATDASGSIVVPNVSEGMFAFVEVSSPAPFARLTEPVIAYVDQATVESGGTVTVTAADQKLPNLTILKLDAQDKSPVSDTVFEVKGIHTGFHADVTTGPDGKAVLAAIPVDSYAATEVSVKEPYAVSDNPTQTIWLGPGDDQQLIFENLKKPLLTLSKTEAGTEDNTPIPGTAFLVEGIDSGYQDEWTTGADGTVSKYVEPGSYQISEKSVPSPYYISASEAEKVEVISLNAGDEKTVSFQNYRMPRLTVRKESSITGDPLEGAKYQIWWAGSNTDTGESRDLGTYYTGQNGEIVLDVEDGWLKIVELEPPAGYALSEPSTQEVYISRGEDKTVLFKDMPLSAVVVYKRDSVSGTALSNCLFQLSYLGGDTSGSGGTVIGTYRTSQNGSFTVTGLKAGYYICEELASDSGHVIDSAPQSFYISGKDQDVVTLYFGNSPLGSLLVKKVSASDNAPLSDVEFFVTTADGTVVGDNNGKFVTGSDGTFLVTDVEPGTVLVVSETRAKPGFLKDDASQSATIRAGQCVNLEFRNQPLGNLVIEKWGRNGTKTVPLEGVKFEIKYADGRYVDAAGGTLSSNGIYYSNSSGQIILSGITGTVVVTELESVDGYSIDPDSQTQTVTVNPNDTQTLRFYNNVVGGVEIIKVNEADKTERIPNTTFEIRRVSDDALMDTVTTGSTGSVFVTLEDDSYYAVETESADGFKLDATPYYFTVSGGSAEPLVVTNRAFSGIKVHKTDKTTGKGIYGVSFILYDANHNPIDQQTTDNRGYAWFENLPGAGRYYLRELENEGYVPDTELKTVYVKSGATTLVEWENIPITGQIQIVKKSADYNPTNGLPAGTLLEGAVFEIYDKAGNLVDTIRSDSRGLAVSKPLPLSRYTIREVKSPEHYGVSEQELTAYLEHEGQIVRFEVTNKSLSTGVSITKTGPKEIMAGQPVRYVFSNIANTSNVRLDSFYWRDTLPAQVRLDTVVTGTYNFPGTYKITYRVNGGEYRTLADNLSTSKNYTLAASAAALGLASNERVTEIMFVFGQAPAGFAQVEKPYLNCTAMANLTAGSSFVNIADVGGVYNGTWVQAVSRWVTTVYGKPTPLPRTGY